MSRRIFTKVLGAQVTAPTQPIPAAAPQEAIVSWLVQEDIEIIAAALMIGSQVPNENDGFAMCEAELSQTSQTRSEGIILNGVAGEGWNTTPAGIDQANCNHGVTFPQGMAIPVKEEGYVYLNAVCVGKTAATSVFDVRGTIYYIKRGA